MSVPLQTGRVCSLPKCSWRGRWWGRIPGWGSPVCGRDRGVRVWITGGGRGVGVIIGGRPMTWRCMAGKTLYILFSRPNIAKQFSGRENTANPDFSDKSNTPHPKFLWPIFIKPKSLVASPRNRKIGWFNFIFLPIYLRGRGRRSFFPGRGGYILYDTDYSLLNKSL